MSIPRGVRPVVWTVPFRHNCHADGMMDNMRDPFLHGLLNLVMPGGRYHTDFSDIVYYSLEVRD